MNRMQSTLATFTNNRINQLNKTYTKMSTKDNTSLEAKLQEHSSPIDMLRHAQVGGYDFPFAPAV